MVERGEVEGWKNEHTHANQCDWVSLSQQQPPGDSDHATQTNQASAQRPTEVDRRQDRSHATIIKFRDAMLLLFRRAPCGGAEV
jgi:hypothetical protein